MLANELSSDISTSSPWQQCLQKIQKEITPSTFETWFRTTDLLVSPEGHACVQVPNQFFADFMEQHFSELIKTMLHECTVAFKSLTFIPTIKDWKIVQPLSETIAEAQTRKIPQTVEKKGQFHPNYTFDKYIVGDGNRMAHAAALAVAEAPGKTTFNPLVIYGGTGLGKTHLLQAIGHFAQTEETADCVIYMTSEEFTTQYINYVIDKKDSTSFYKKFNNVDLLLIDDIHFLGGKPGTQKEFFRIFNRLLLEQKQIILSSDRPPDKITDMMEHIINRFMGGLITDIQPPNLETRMAILRKKAETDGLSLPDEVIQFVAGHITSNVRLLPEKTSALRSHRKSAEILFPEKTSAFPFSLFSKKSRNCSPSALTSSPPTPANGTCRFPAQLLCTFVKNGPNSPYAPSGWILAAGIIQRSFMRARKSKRTWKMTRS
jgi:chromosomal replication initiator protein